MSDLVVTRWGARIAGRALPCSVGRGGIVPAALKREGDGATPAGVLQIVGALFRADRLAAVAVPDWALPIGPGDLWSDDGRDAAYNHLVKAPHRFSHERLRRADPLYDLVLVTDWNWPEAVPGRGSAIFLHRWRRPRHPTAGCLAFDPKDLRWIAWHLPPGSRVEIRR